MNLINDAWLPVIRASGKKEQIAPWQIAERNDPVIELNAPRPDFQGALYQFLIGLLQTCFAPADHDVWLQFWEEPSDGAKLHACFSAESTAFNIDNTDGPCFMQDFENFEGKELPIEDLVGGQISDNARDKNRDLFVKRNCTQRVSPYWAAIALFNMQITGVLAWGQHRIGLRGNGPLTTLIMPASAPGTLWQKLWLNVLTQEDFVSVPGNQGKQAKEYIFPWLAKTRISPNKEITSPEDGHPLQVYWPLPRRIRLIVEDSDAVCDISGEKTQKIVRHYKRINDGVYYKNGWKHPLTPYTRKDKTSFPQAVTGSKISFDYKDWSPLTINGYVDDMECSRAQIVSVFHSERRRDIGDSGRLWCFAYDAESANVIRWYDARLPLLCADDAEAENIRSWVNDMIEAAKVHALALKLALVRAWFNPQIDSTGKESWSYVVNKKGDTGQAHLSTLRFVEENYWKDTETVFYGVLSEIIGIADSRDRPLGLYKKWIDHVRIYTLRTFESEAFSFAVEGRGIRRAVLAKEYLISELWPKKGILAELNKLIKTLEKEEGNENSKSISK